MVLDGKFGGSAFICLDKEIIEAAIEAVKKITHHGGGRVENTEMVSKKFLSPSTDLVDGAVVLKYHAHGTAITNPIELGTPEKRAVLANTPVTASSFSPTYRFSR
jgi:hypothetical protein